MMILAYKKNRLKEAVFWTIGFYFEGD